jgi:hypothetical protein
MKGRSCRTNCPFVLIACHKLGQGDRVCSLHEPSKNACVGEGYLDREGANVFHPLILSNRNFDKASLHMAHFSTHLALFQAVCCHIKTKPKFFVAEHS